MHMVYVIAFYLSSAPFVSRMYVSEIYIDHKVCCSVLQCVAVCTVLQCTAAFVRQRYISKIDIVLGLLSP